MLLEGLLFKVEILKEKLPYLNVGCGNHYHPDWTNLDFTSTGPGVIAHNLLDGIPFESNLFEVVYHSHVLEHFAIDDAKAFIDECYRVLKQRGILRIAIPDLEQIASEYLRLLSRLKLQPNDPILQANYDWIVLELYDQTVRNVSGGNMAKFLMREMIVNEDYILSRCGHEVKQIIERYRIHSSQHSLNDSQTSRISPLQYLVQKFKNLGDRVRWLIIKALLDKDARQTYESGRFRKMGEIHQWMYDEHSLKRILLEAGFTDMLIRTAFSSAIPKWTSYELETVAGKVRKPDSLFLEARKP